MHYLGTGKIEELHVIKDRLKFDTLIVDDELTPLQQQNLEKSLETKVVDRVSLILDIFARRARTREGQLQVELAQYEYLLPRLAGRWLHLERLGGGIGTRGPGESQLESDRRLIQRRIQHLRSQMESLRKHRMLYRKQRQRSGIPIIALVGYTNAGKSTLFNSLSHAGVLAKDEMFSTLDPTTRRIMLPDKRAVLLTDTVGFIRKLPPAIVAAFQATLEELEEASVLVHVVDFTLHNAQEQFETVEHILADLGLKDKPPRITALNKVDLLPHSGKEWDEEAAMKYLSERGEPLNENTVFVSATKKWGLSRLLELISQLIPRNTVQPVWESPS